MDAYLQIIVAQHISQNANDQQEVEPALEALQETTDRLPEQLSADNGYFSGGNLQVLEHSSIDAYIATDKGEKTPKTLLTARIESGSRLTLNTTKLTISLSVPKDRS